MNLSIVSLCFVGLALSANAAVRYDNYKVFRFTPTSSEQQEILRGLETENPGVIFWKGVRGIGQPVDVMFPPHLQSDMLASLRSRGFASSEFISNVQELIDQETEAMLKASPRLTWTAYHTTQQIYDFLNEQAAANPSTVSVETIGKSFENRDLRVIKIAKGGSNKPIIWLDANIHAREWITNAVATYVINELINSNDPAIQQLANNFVWYIMPVMNPDGYEYTRTSDRMWRKTRSTTGSPLGCRGADPNRNWGFHWMEGGASTNPCTDTYGGSRAFSEIETEHSSNFITTIASETVLYLSLHSYSQLILLPYGHENRRIPQYNEYMRIANAAAQAIASRFGTNFVSGNIVDLLYVASGGSMDWVKGFYDTEITFTLELRDTGRYGFLLPPDQIVPSSLEFIDGLKVIVNELQATLDKKLAPIEAVGATRIAPIMTRQRPTNKLPVITPVNAPTLRRL